MNDVDVGGVNLAAISSISGYGAATFLREDYTFTITSNAASYDSSGLKIDSGIFEVGQRYVLTFRMSKTSGIVNTIGGHMSGCTQKALHLNGVKQSKTWSAGITIPSGVTESVVELHFVYVGTASDNNLYIQPNRGATTSGAYAVQIWDIQVEKGTVATSWYPAIEDIEVEMELQLTNARAQITAATDAIRQEVETTYARADDLNTAVVR